MKNFEKLAAIKDSETFLHELETAETPNDFQNLLEKHGVVVSMDEIREMAEAMMASKGNELSESDLENVAAGGDGWLSDLGQKIYDWMEEKVTNWLNKNLFGGRKVL